VINSSGQLGTAPAGTAMATSASTANANEVRHQQAEIDELEAEVAQLQKLLHRHR
jgi:hypothetical protein